MAIGFDTLTAFDALVEAGMDRKQARAVVEQLRLVAETRAPVNRQEFESGLARLKAVLLKRIG